MEQANSLEKSNQLKESFAIRSEPVNQSLTSLFGNKVEETQIEKYPQEIEYYLAKNEEKENLISNELNKLDKSSQDLTPQDYQRKNNLINERRKLTKSKHEM